MQRATKLGLFTLLTMSIVGTSLSLAAKPGGSGGGGSGSTGGGTIYFWSGGGLNTMKSDGSGKTALPLNVAGTPSRMLHGGHRWFLTTRRIAEESQPNGWPR